jgi:hypothetical protein
MVHFNHSYKFGKKEELKVLPIICEYFKREITQYPNQYDKYDFFDSEYQYELKSRTNTKMKYPDTMITFNKMTDETPLILLFNYTDRLCFIQYDKEKFSKYKKCLFSRAGLEEDEKEHIYIPIEDLTDIFQY